MENTNDILMQHLSEQMALEEHVCRTIEDLISEIDDTQYSDAKNLLTKTTKVLQGHFTLLNELLDKLEKDALVVGWTPPAVGNGGGYDTPSTNREQRKERVSRKLRDVYSALNLLTISNTLLHTTALALDCQEVATVALTHLENVAALIVKIGELVPDVVARELRTESPKIDLSVAQIALKNIQLARQKVS